MLKICAIAAAFAFAGSAFAAPITETYDFTATGINDLSDPAHVTPQTSVTGRVSLTYDPAVSTSNQLVDWISLTVDGHTYSRAETAFNFSPGFGGQFLIGGILNGINSTFSGTNDFFLYFDHALTYGGFAYTTANDPFGAFVADSRSPPSDVVVTRGTVPEAPTFTLVALGVLAGFAAAARAERREARR
jgi:hypothetical protein